MLFLDVTLFCRTQDEKTDEPYHAEAAIPCYDDGYWLVTVPGQ